MAKKYMISVNVDEFDEDKILRYVMYNDENKCNNGSEYDGYILTPFNNLKALIEQDTPEHPFTFDDMEEARQLAFKLGFERFRIKKVPVPYIG